MRSTAVTSAAAATRLVGEARHLGLKALTPQPHLVGLEAERAHDLAAGVHDGLELGGRGPGGPHGGLVGQVVGRGARGVRPVSGGDQDVAVLDPGVELDVGTHARAQLCIERSDDLAGLLGARVATSEVDHRAVVAHRGQVAAVGDAVRREAQPERGRLDGRPPGVEAGRVVAQDRHVADVAPRRHPGRDHRGPSDLPAPGEAGEVRHRRNLERRLAAERLDGQVRAPVGHAHDVLHGAESGRPPGELRTGTAPAAAAATTRAAAGRGRTARCQWRARRSPCRARGRRRARAAGR